MTPGKSGFDYDKLLKVFTLQMCVWYFTSKSKELAFIMDGRCPHCGYKWQQQTYNCPAHDYHKERILLSHVLEGPQSPDYQHMRISK